MQLTEAIELIRNKHISTRPGSWVDLGAGTGLFTYALANLLQPGSTIYAIDSSPVKLIPQSNPNGIAIVRQQSDFIKDTLDLSLLDGILMANSLHYVKHKSDFLTKLRPALSDKGLLLIVEYDTTVANQWVPYPINFAGLKELMKENIFGNTVKLAERPSAFGKKNMYAALIGVGT